MDVKQAVTEIGSKFVYKKDPKIVFDHWSAMKEQVDGSLHGDCDDFALSVLWKICDEDIVSFLVNVMILHRYRIYFAKTNNGEGHAVGYAKGLYFDNWTREALPKDEFIKKTNHKIQFPWLLPFMFVQLTLGLFMRFKKRK